MMASFAGRLETARDDVSDSAMGSPALIDLPV